MRALVFSLALTVGLTAGLGSTFVGCGSAETAFDCHQVCDRYQSCFDKNYDVDGCTSRCREKAAKDSSIRNRADECEACIDDKSCAAATFQCADSCLQIVP